MSQIQDGHVNPRADMAYWRRKYSATQASIQAICARTSGSVSTWYDSEGSKKRQSPFPEFAIDLLSLYYGDEPRTFWLDRVEDRRAYEKELRERRK
jgi:hypothetical protein